MRQILAVSAVAVSALIGAAPAYAGVVITADATPAAGPPHSVSFQLEPDRMREMTGNSEMIYRGDLGKFWTLDTKDHTYREMNRDTMRQMRAQMDAYMKQMRDKLPSMPEAQRKQLEAMLAERENPKPQEITYEKAGAARTVGSWTCTPYNVKVNGATHEQLCLIRMSEVGLKRDDVKAFASLSSFIEDAGPPGQDKGRAAAFDFDAMAKQVGFDAFPVESTNYGADGKEVGRTVVKSIERKTIAADTFEIPKGYQSKELSAHIAK